jgi:alpha-mannosidase
VSLLNDCKYGHDIKGHMMRLTLIKCATTPDPEADQGLHHFTYSLLPHRGDWRHSTVGEAARLNDPLLHLIVIGDTDARGPALPSSLGLASCDADHVVLDTIKAAEDGDGLVVRLYEACGQRGAVRLSFAPRLANVWECNLVEEDERSLAIQDNSVAFQIKPYQIKSFRARLLPPGHIWGSDVSFAR